jgi:hypothetical protein
MSQNYPVCFFIKLQHQPNERHISCYVRVPRAEAAMSQKKKRALKVEQSQIINSRIKDQCFGSVFVAWKGMQKGVIIRYDGFKGVLAGQLEGS